MGSKGKWTIWEREGNNNADYYGVLRGAKSVGVAGVLLEHGFHTNRANTAWLLKDANLKKLAQAEAKVLADYFGLTKDTAKPAVAVKYYPKTAYKGVSLVDGLKSVKADSSFKNRTKIAKANGISVYLGTPTQNTKLLRLLKEGKLVKP